VFKRSTTAKTKKYAVRRLAAVRITSDSEKRVSERLKNKVKNKELFYLKTSDSENKSESKMKVKKKEMLC